MLKHLDIRDMLIIERLTLDFGPGLTVLTGETGAGKSILLDCLGFVLGWRGRAELVRQGADQGEVTAIFEASAAVKAVLQESGLPSENEVILRRANTQDGRKTAWVNDRRASGEVLRALSEALVELHGQQDDKGLLNPRGHLDLLDAFGGYDDLLAATRSAWRDWSGARKALDQATKAHEAAKAEEEFLRFSVSELDELDPKPGEDAELDTLRRRMQAARRTGEGIARAHAALGVEGAEGRLMDAERWLVDASGDLDDLLSEPLEALARARDALGEAEAGVARAIDALDFDPGALDAAEERLFAIRALARKHSVAPDELGAFADDLRARAQGLDEGEKTLTSLASALKDAEAAFDAAADALGAARAKAAERLDAAMADELAPLKMERAVFTTDIAEAEPGPTGRDAVAFTVATNPGAPAGPLSRIASGGELSRFLLALKVCLHREGGSGTLIFDEIDRGVGGATADAVGRRLAALAEGAQVLVVTHSPQVAARGAHHLQVAKSVAGGLTRSDVAPLDAKARVDEIARMLAGDTVTDAARKAAEALLAP